MKITLAQTNRYIRDEKENLHSAIRSSLESSYFEGARTLRFEHLQGTSETARSNASAK